MAYRSDGRKGVAVFGQRRQPGNSLRVFTEKQFSSGDEQNGLSREYGLDYSPAKEWTLSALFQNSNPDDDDETQWLTANNLRFLINEEWTGVGKLNFSYSDNHDTGQDDGRFAEFDVGLAYRPVYQDRLNILSKYTYLYDLDSAGQEDADTDERSHVVSLEGIYDLNRRWELGSKLAWKRGEVREDLTDLDYQNNGWFLNFVGKL